MVPGILGEPTVGPPLREGRRGDLLCASSGPLAASAVRALNSPSATQTRGLHLRGWHVESRNLECLYPAFLTQPAVYRREAQKQDPEQKPVASQASSHTHPHTRPAPSSSFPEPGAPTATAGAGHLLGSPEQNVLKYDLPGVPHLGLQRPHLGPQSRYLSLELCDKLRQRMAGR